MKVKQYVNVEKIKQFTDHHRSWIFVFLLLLVYFVNDFFFLMFKEPFGIHFIRQTDSLSFVSNYFQNGFKFFEPQIYHIQSEQGRNACEFPIIYYLTSLSYLLFGEKDYILRIVTLFLSSVGFFYLFKLVYLLLKDALLSIFLTLVFCSSTVLLYYSNNFLPDASVLAFTFIAWYHFFSHLKNDSARSLFNSFLFFFIASLIKVTYFINPIAALLSLFVFDFLKNRNIVDVLKNNGKAITYFLVSLILILAWNFYVITYNELNRASYFLIKPLPIWNMDKKQIREILDILLNNWKSDYYYPTTVHTFILIFIIGCSLVKYWQRNTLIPALILSIGSLCYFLLFFEQFRYHDYYFLAFLPAIVLLITHALLVFRQKFSKIANLPVFYLFFIGLSFLSLFYSHKKLSERFDYRKEDKFADIGKKFHNTKYFLDKKGVSRKAKMIVYTDLTPNGALFFMKRPGWNIPDTSRQSQSFLKVYLDCDPDYIIFTNKTFIKPEIVSDFVGVENENYIYRIKK